MSMGLQAHDSGGGVKGVVGARSMRVGFGEERGPAWDNCGLESVHEGSRVKADGGGGGGWGLLRCLCSLAVALIHKRSDAEI